MIYSIQIKFEEGITMKKIKLFSVALLLIIAIIWSASTGKDNNDEPKVNTDVDTTTNETVEVEYPITDAWVYKYNIQTGKSDFAPCGYIDEYTSLVADTDKTVSRAVTGTYMYLGTITGYQNEDKTIKVYQVKLPELAENFVLTNDAFELDYSGNSKMIEVDGWVYMDGTTIIAVSPLYSE